MPRQPQLDAPETLHHVMVRGIERTAIFRDDRDRTDFVTRLASLAQAGAWSVYALELVWSLHLNPLRAQVVATLHALDRYPWTGHSALLRTVSRRWQDTETILT